MFLSTTINGAQPRSRTMKKLCCEFLLILSLALPAATSPEYSIQAVRYASAEDEVAGLVMSAHKGEKINIAMVVWLIRGGGHNILFDSGYHRDTFLKYFPSTEYLRPDEAVKLAGVQPAEITDIVISHAHWDHLGGIDLFPKATVWIQKEEFRYYTGDAWQPGGNHGGIDPEDVQQLVKLNTEDRKSTRLNSSHGYISYAVFCLKKKKYKNSVAPGVPKGFQRACSAQYYPSITARLLFSSPFSGVLVSA